MLNIDTSQDCNVSDKLKSIKANKKEKINEVMNKTILKEYFVNIRNVLSLYRKKKSNTEDVLEQINFN